MPFKIRTKLIIAFFAIIVPFIVIGGILVLYSADAIHNSVHKVQSIAEERAEITNLILSIERALMPGNDYVITGDKKYIDDFYKVSNEVEKRLQKVDEVIHAEDRKILSNTVTAWQNMKDISQKIFAIPEPVGNKDAARLMEEMDYAWAYPAIERLKELRATHIEEFKNAANIADRAWAHSWIIMAGGAFALTFIGIFFAFFYASRFTRPIKAIHSGADAIAGGDFNIRLDVKTGDEIEQLSNAMNEMAAQLDSFYSNLQGMVDDRTREVKESEERFRVFFNSGNEAVFVHTITVDGKPGNFIEVNEVACKRLGYTREELLNMSPYDIDASDMAERREAMLKDFTEKGHALFEMVHVARDGRRIPVEINIRLFNLWGRPMGIAFARDITERKKAEESLRLSRALYLNTLENMMEGCQIIDFDWRYVYVNDAVVRHARKAKEELLGYKMIELYPGIENTEMFAALRRCMDERVPHTMENEFIYPGGAKAWFELSMQPVSEGVFILSIDITERKKAEEALKESETRFRGIVETAKDAMICISEKGTIYLWNKSTEEMFGYSADEAMGKDIHALIVPERFHEQADEGFKTFLQTGTGPVIGKTIELIGLKKGGAEFPVELSVSAMNIKGKWHAVGIIRDITERKKAEDKIKEQMDYLVRFERATVQREFRMKELKDRVKEMEEGLKKVRGRSS